MARQPAKSPKKPTKAPARGLVKTPMKFSEAERLRKKEAEEQARIEEEKYQNYLTKRRARDAAKRAEKKMAERAAVAKPSRVDRTKLGVKQQSIAAANPPKRMVLAREQLSDAFELMGGVPSLVKWGKTNPTEFYRIWSKLLPKEVVEDSREMPLEQLLAKLADRAEQSVAQAATEIGQEILDEAAQRALLEDAQKIYNPSISDKVTVQ